MRLRTRPKYGNQKTNGSASKREAKRLAELRLLEKAGEIKDLRTQVKFELIPAQYIDGKCVERACSYTCDFQYADVHRVAHGELVTEDSKGFSTEVFKIKRKLMLFVHGIRVREV